MRWLISNGMLFLGFYTITNLLPLVPDRYVLPPLRPYLYNASILAFRHFQHQREFEWVGRPPTWCTGNSYSISLMITVRSQPITRLDTTTGCLYTGTLIATSETCSIFDVFERYMSYYDWRLFLGTNRKIVVCHFPFYSISFCSEVHCKDYVGPALYVRVVLRIQALYHRQVAHDRRQGVAPQSLPSVPIAPKLVPPSTVPDIPTTGTNLPAGPSHSGFGGGVSGGPVEPSQAVLSDVESIELYVSLPFTLSPYLLLFLFQNWVGTGDQRGARGCSFY